MRSGKWYKLISLLICTAMLLTLLGGCADGKTAEPENVQDAPEQDAEEKQDDTPPVTENIGYSEADTVFSLCYAPAYSMNPIYGTNSFNCDLFGLVYEGLFAVNGKFEAEPVLCTDWETEDGITYTFHLREDVKFHSGERFTAEDASFSIAAAMSGKKFGSRLSVIKSAWPEDDHTLMISLDYADYSLPQLLDIPIVPSGTPLESAPAGTGLYMMSADGKHLLPYPGHRDSGSAPVNAVYLKEVASGSLAEAFSGRTVDILDIDPAGTRTFNINTEYETRYYDTTDLVYLGFNMMFGITEYPEVRRAIGYLVDRDSICSDIYNNSAVPAPLMLSPVLDIYDENWAQDVEYSRNKFTSALAAMGMADIDSDGFIEGVYGDELELTVLVCSENPYKVAVAEKLVSEMKAGGVPTKLESVSWDDYLRKLQDGEYSVYIGETRLQADFDLSPLYLAGGSLNYGGISGGEYEERIKAFLAAESDEDRAAKAEELCTYLTDRSSIVPVAYKKHAVLTHVGVASGLMPTQSNIFYGITDWKINLGRP